MGTTFRRLDLNTGIINNDTPNYDRLLNDIRRTEMNTRDEEHELFYQYWSEEDEQKRIEIRNKIVGGHLRFILSFATKYGRGKASNALDLFGVLAMGMLKAVDGYTDTTFTFLTYAVSRMRHELWDYNRKWGTIVRQTNNAKIGNKVKDFENKFFLLEGRYPSTEESLAYLIAMGEKISREDILSFKSISINNPLAEEMTYEDGEEFSTYTASNNIAERMETDANKELVWRMLRTLTEQERAVICLAYGIGTDYAKKDDAIAVELDLTRQRVQQIRKKAEGKLASIGRRVLA